ncbi:uncharacterized protein CDV56_106022 [Aspergillus thermomutatus]|uniref:Uncharacterized protein n=1 Tax=Aspergillus thermomutatus TaxID=41047 RepID=A0A397H6C8_ASPTH|nr:uncharacterized protein CDV56_106022 [Aspergillus thermomutatus]RHZ58239.1 hypothetical protein CDV56_106022 [Aspergillus thermomutatus]
MVAKADLAPDAIDAYFDGFSDVIRSTCDGGAPDKIANAPADKSTARNNETTQRAAASTKVKWSHYQCTHGGAIQGSRVQSEGKLQSSDSSFDDFWTDVIAPLIDTFASMAKEAGLALFHLFSPADSITPRQALSQLGSDMLLKLLDGIKRIAKGLVSVGSTLIRDIKSAFNYKINIPIFSWLYKHVLSGNDLTVLDGFALVVAIPVTVLTKIVTGERPADMTTLNYGDLMAGTADATQMMQFSQFASSSSLCCRPFLAALELVETVFGAQHARFQACHIKQYGRVQPLASGGDLVTKYWKDVFAVIVTVATIPFNPAETAYDLRWGSWAVCTVNRGVDMAIRRVTAAGPTKKALGMATIMLGSVNYGLVIAARIEEFQAPGNQEALVVLDCVSGTFDLVDTVCHGAAQLDVDPESAAALEVASMATGIFAIVITGATYITRAAEGEYNHIISYL